MEPLMLTYSNHSEKVFTYFCWFLQKLAQTHHKDCTKSDSSVCVCVPINAECLHSPYMVQDVLQTLDT